MSLLDLDIRHPDTLNLFEHVRILQSRRLPELARVPAGHRRARDRASCPLRGETIKRISLATTAVVFLMSLHMIFGSERRHSSTPASDYAGMQNLFAVDWIPSFNIQYLMGTDGISFPLVVLTAFI